ncbi:MazG-like family protein [Vibrio sp. TRT 21S02]|uniref:MazG-like family protein n=1 Tax=Vibrio sp. TRT 21S02 TaxID=3418507 RepID=UPI003CECAD75
MGIGETANFSFVHSNMNFKYPEKLKKHLLTEALVSTMNEMSAQDEKWGADRELSPFMWNAILVEEVGEVSKAILEKEGLREELVQVAAVALQWIENIDRNRGTGR